MKFLLDHDVPVEVGQLLRYWKHDVRLVREILPVTAADATVFGFHNRNSGSLFPAIGSIF